MADVNDPGVDKRESSDAGASSGSQSEDPVYDLYLESARDLAQNLSDPTDKETCLVWVDFIRAHRTTVPTLKDFIILLLFALHQEIRAAPFDQLPPPVEELSEERINLFSASEKIMEANQEYEESKSRVQSTKAGGAVSCKESIPVLEWGSGGDTTDYLATQKIPGFGRQCYYATCRKELPFWWPAPSGDGDYLSRIAQYMEWQREKGAKLGECQPILESITRKGWTENAKKMRLKESHDSAYGFKWHKLSRLPLSRTPFDKKEIREFMKSAESKGKDILKMDEQADGLHDRTFVDTDKLSFAPEYRNIFGKKSHGTVSHTKTMANELEERRKDKEYNTSWTVTVDDESTYENVTNESANFMRKVNENELQRMLRTSPCERNFEDEANISNLKEMYETSRTGMEPPPPSPEDGSYSDILRRGVSWNIPAFRKTYNDPQGSSPCQRNMTQVQSPHETSSDYNRTYYSDASDFQNQSAIPDAEYYSSGAPDSSVMDLNVSQEQNYLNNTFPGYANSSRKEHMDRSYAGYQNPNYSRQSAGGCPNQSRRSLPERRNQCRPCSSKSYGRFGSFPEMNETNPTDKSLSYAFDDETAEDLFDYGEDEYNSEYDYIAGTCSDNFGSSVFSPAYASSLDMSLGHFDWPEQEHIYDISSSFPEPDN